MKRLILFTLFFIPQILLASDLVYGLHIKAFPYKDSEKTTLILEEGKNISLQNDLTLTFDLYVRNESAFGNVFRIITDTNENIDLLFSIDDNKRSPVLIVNDSIYVLPEEIILEQWTSVSVTLSPKQKNIILNYGDSEQTVPFQFKGIKGARISFGLCPFDGFLQLDIASVNLKDIRLYRKNKLYRFWKLEKHSGDKCYDLVGQVPADVTNPVWLIDEYISWNKIYEEHYERFPSVAFDPFSDNFYLVNNSKEIHVFNVERMEKSSIRVREGQSVSNHPNQLIYIPENKTLLSYNINEDIYSVFSFEKRTWSNDQISTKDNGYWNNSTSYYLPENTLISFGGYGFHKYNHELLKLYPFDDKETQKTWLTDISPRYGTSSVIVNDTLYIFGGRGSKTGRQEIFPQDYSDLYAVDLKTNGVTKLWEITDETALQTISAENMVYDPDKNCFYMFTLKDGGILLKFTTGKGEFIPVSLPINQNIDGQYLYANIYHSSRQNKLYVVMSKSTVDYDTDFVIYSLNYPTDSVTDLSRQQLVTEKEERAGYKYSVFLLFFLLLSGISGYFYIRKKGKKQRKEITETCQTIIPSTENYDFSRKCICLLGEFYVKDENGKDITSQFTRTSTALLILMILATVENPKGISGDKILQILWSDKNRSAAQNNRNVYLSKLRTILQKIGGVEIIVENGYWRVAFSNGAFCDYVEAIKHFSILNSQIYDEKSFNCLLEILLRGSLLSNMEEDWLDKFKSEFSNLTIDTLTPFLRNQEKVDSNLRLKIADTLFQHDFINEEALHIKCKILSDSGKIGLAKSIYDNFCKEYANLLGSNYSYSLNKVVNGENLSD